MDGDETRQRLIDVTIELLDRDGNHALRLADVARDAGVAVSTIYAHFRDRTDLVAAARLQQFKAHAEEALAVVAGSLEPGLDRDGFVEVAAWPTLVDPDDPDSRVRRWDRVEAIADSRHIPDLATQLGDLQDSLNRTVIEFIREAQDLGWIEPTVDPAALAMFTQVLRLGLVQWDVSDRTRPEQAAWDELIRRIFSCVLTPSVPISAIVDAGRDDGTPAAR
jgi:AcrR family transcriptional regulator